jgi:mitotic spindle assembly checkpoint protein MAD1
MMSDLAQAQMKETAATRRATEAEEKYQKIESSASSAVEALAVAERQIAMMKGQVESLNRIVKSYEDEGNAAAARKSSEKEKSKAASDRATKELEKLLANAKERIAILDGELSEAKTRAETAEAAATAAAEAVPVENPATVARIQTLEREREELLERLNRARAQEDDSKALKVLHFKSNPVASAMRSALEKEVESLRSEAAGLREALSKLQQGSVSSASEADMTVMKRKLEDLQKREQRLMTVFKRQISAFREACHKIFGYKIEMNEDAGACTFTLTSDYATNPTDAFAFKYDDKSSTVSLKETPFVAAPEIRRSVETFVTRMRSIPAFIANHTIETFNQRDEDDDDDGVDAMDA